MANTECGIVGLPNVGKSGLFNVLTGAGVSSSNYPFCTIDPNVGVVSVPDARLVQLANLSHSERIVFSDMKFVDIAGLVQGAADGQGLGNRFLSHIRETHAIAHVVRCFDDEQVIHVSGRVDPESDIAVINLELILADYASAEGIYCRLQKANKGKKELELSLTVLDRVLQHLDQQMPLRTLALSEEEQKVLQQYAFLTKKPVLYVANMDEKSFIQGGNQFSASVERIAKQEGAIVIPICVKLEEELMLLSHEEQVDYLNELGIKETGLSRLIRAAYDTLGLISYFTTGPQETRSWAISKGMTAAEASGVIHSDIQKGFIRAEVVTVDDMIAYGGRVGVKEAGKMRSEGRDYIVQDGDVILFLHKQ